MTTSATPPSAAPAETRYWPWRAPTARMRSPIPAVTRPCSRRPATTRCSSSGRPPWWSCWSRLLEPWRLGEAETIHAIRALRSAMHGFVDLERIGGFGIDLPLEESYQRMVSDLAAGLGRG